MNKSIFLVALLSGTFIIPHAQETPKMPVPLAKAQEEEPQTAEEFAANVSKMTNGAGDAAKAVYNPNGTRLKSKAAPVEDHNDYERKEDYIAK